MLIFAKNKLENTIYDKVSRGTNGIELHLDEDFINFNVYWNEEIINNVPIYVVHAPLIKGGDTCIENVQYRDVLTKTCSFANKIANTQGHDVLVVIHLGTSVHKLKALDAYESVKYRLCHLVELNERIHIAIENVSCVHKNEEQIYVPHEITFTDAATLVKDINHPRIGTCIDICHAMMDIKLMMTLRRHFGEEVIKNNIELHDGMSAIFAANKNIIKLIHFANCGGSGLGSGHGAPFTNEDAHVVDQILNLYNLYEYDCPLTIEVIEQDYRFGENYTITKNTLEACLENKSRSSKLLDETP